MRSWIRRPARTPLFLVGLVLFLGGCGRRSGVAPRATETVEGQVRGAQDQPLANVAVVLGPHPADGRVPVAATKTDASGKFRLPGIPPGHYYVEARRVAFAPARADLEVVVGTAARIELRLAALTVLKGHIQDGHGTPVPLAHILAFAVAEAAAPTLHETRADGQGRFELSDLTAGMHRLLIEAPGLGTAVAGPVPAPDDKVVVILPGESRSVTGVITRAGRPFGGARVRLSGEAVAEMRTTDADGAGRFVFAGLGPGSYALRAESGALVSPVATDVSVGQSSALRQVDVALEPGAYLRGRVVDQAGAGVSGADVHVDLIPATSLWTAVPTDKNGDWTSPPLPPGKYQLRARHAGFTARRTAVVDVPRARPAPGAAPPPAVTLELLRSGRITGRIVSEEGAPLSGATIHDRPAELEELGVLWSPLPAAAAAAAMPTTSPAGARYRGGAHHVESAVDGLFVLNDVSPGRMRLEVLRPNSVPFRGRPLMIGAGEGRDLGTIMLATAIPLQGRVVDVEDRPVPGAHIVARAQVRGAADDLYAVTDRDGAFTIPLAAGDYMLTASLANRTQIQAAVQVRTGVSPPPVTLRLPKVPPPSGAVGADLAKPKVSASRSKKTGKGK